MPRGGQRGGGSEQEEKKNFSSLSPSTGAQHGRTHARIVRIGSVAMKRRRSAKDELQKFAVVTWNVEGKLRALSDHIVDALEGLITLRPVVLCLLEHWLQPPPHAASAAAHAWLESCAARHGYDVTWTYSSRKGRDGLVALVRRSSADTPHALRLVAPPREPPLFSEACGRWRLIHVELESMHVLLVYAPNSGNPEKSASGERRPKRLAFWLDEWEASMRALASQLQRSSGEPKPLLVQGDLNVARSRELDCYGSTAKEWGYYTMPGRTEEEARALQRMLDEASLVDGFRWLHPTERSATCWASFREQWKRYDYALASEALVSDAGVGGVRLVDVRHLSDAFQGAHPDHVPVESVFTVC